MLVTPLLMVISTTVSTMIITKSKIDNEEKS